MKQKMQNGQLLIYFSFLSVMYFVKSQFNPYPLAGDEPNYLFNSLVLSKFKTVHSKPFYSDSDLVSIIYPSGVLSPHVIGDSTVSYHGVGLSFFLLPSTFFPNPVTVARTFMILIVAFLFTMLLRLILQSSKTNFESRIAYFGVSSIALGAPVMFNVDLVYPEYLGSLLFLIISLFGYNIIVKGKTSIGLAIAATISAFAIPWLHVRYIPVTALLICILALESRRTIDKRLSFLRISPLIFSLSLSLLLLSFAYKSWQGTYDFFFLRKYQVSGFEIQDYPAIYRTIGTYLYSGSEGLIAWQPILILAIAGIPLISRSKQIKYALYFSLLLLTYFTTVSQAGALGGDTPPMHYTAPLIPFLVFPLHLSLVTILGDIKNFRRNRAIRFYRNIKETRIKYPIVAVLGISALTLWGLTLSLSGSVDKGATFIRSDVQGDPIVRVASLTNTFWPDFSGPNLKSDISIVGPIDTWSDSGNGKFLTTASQGFRPSDDYINNLEIWNPSLIEANLNFKILAYDNRLLSDDSQKLVILCEQNFEIGPESTELVSLPCSLNYLAELSWAIEVDNPEIKITETEIAAIKPAKQSGFEDLGFFVLAAFLLVHLSLFLLRKSE